MRTAIRYGRLAWLALASLALLAVAIGVSAWIGLLHAREAAPMQSVVDACLLVSRSTAASVWSGTPFRPLTVAALAFLAVSLVWACLRLAASLVSGWREEKRLARYQWGEFPTLDRALRVSPDVDANRVRVIRSPASTAFTLGVIHPKIYLSAALLQGSTEPEVRAVLLHEHAHARARDPLRQAAAQWLSDFLWFLPVARGLARAFSAMAELRADEAAVAAGSDALELASVIVRTARGASGPRLAAALGGPALVEHRVLRLLGRRPGYPYWNLRGPGVASAVILIAVLALLVAPAVATSGGPSVDSTGEMRLSMGEMRQMMEHMMSDCPGEAGFDGPATLHRCPDRAGASGETDAASGS